MIKQQYVTWPLHSCVPRNFETHLNNTHLSAAKMSNFSKIGWYFMGKNVLWFSLR